MPIRTHIPNIEAIKAEVALLEEQRGILKSPEMIAALKAEIAGLTAQKFKALADIDEAKTRLANIQNEQTQAALENIQEITRTAKTEAARLMATAQTEAADIVSRAKTEEEAIKANIKVVAAQLEKITAEKTEATSGWEAARQSADEYLARISVKTEEKLKELNERRNACRQEVDMLCQALKDDKARLEDRAMQIERQGQDVIERQKAADLQAALLRKAQARQAAANQKAEADLRLEYDKLSARKDLLDAKEKGLAKREASLATQEAGLVNLKSELDLREQKATQDRLDLNAKWDEILKREADLETNWKVYAKAKKKLDLKLKEMED